MSKQKKYKRPEVTPEVAAWRASLKVGDLVKLDALIDKLEPICRIDGQLADAGLPEKPIKMFRVPYRCSHRGPCVGILSTEVMWPPPEGAYAEDLAILLNDQRFPGRHV